MAQEITALEANQTWCLDLFSWKEPSDCKWAYKVKYKSNGTIERYKVHLMAIGFTQIKGLDFHETCAPVAKLVSVHVFLSLAIARGWDLHQMNISIVFLHGDLEENVTRGYQLDFKRVMRVRCVGYANHSMVCIAIGSQN